MKKTLLAAALMAGFAGVAQAETSVTLYGIVDGGIGYQKLSGKASYASDRSAVDSESFKKTGMINGIQYGNRWGLKGSEDLGNGLRAVFVLESGFDLATGSQAQGGRLFGRQATLGLASDSWGQLDFGRQTNVASKYLPGVVSPFGASFAQANAGVVFTQANTARYDNMIMYQTPNFSGFQFGIGYSFNVDGTQEWKSDANDTGSYEYNTDDLNKKAITAGLRYGNGPLAVALTYDQVKAPNTNTTRTNATLTSTGSVDRDITNLETSTVRAWALGGSYDFEVVKVYAGFGQTRNGIFQAQAPYDTAYDAQLGNGSFVGVEGLKFNSYSLGVSAPLGNGTIMAGWMMADPTSKPEGTAWDTREMEKNNTYSLGYTYDLSKRTNLYAIGSYSDNVYFLPEAKQTLVGVGLVHKF